MIGVILERFPSTSIAAVFLMSDRDIVNAFFPNQRPKANNTSASTDYKTLFFNVGRARGMSAKQIETEWAKQLKAK